MYNMQTRCAAKQSGISIPKLFDVDKQVIPVVKPEHQQNIVQKASAALLLKASDASRYVSLISHVNKTTDSDTIKPISTIQIPDNVERHFLRETRIRFTRKLEVFLDM